MASRRRDDEDYSYDRYNYHQDRTYSAANTCFQRVKAGAMMGGSIGLLAGLIFGTFSVIRGPRMPAGDAMVVLGKYMVQLGATMAVFLSVGTALHCEPAQLGGPRRLPAANAMLAPRLLALGSAGALARSPTISRGLTL